MMHIVINYAFSGKHIPKGYPKEYYHSSY